jgi:hypothetical protein
MRRLLLRVIGESNDREGSGRGQPWLGIQRLIRVSLGTRWGADEWLIVKAELRNALKERSRLQRAGWFSWAVAKRVGKPQTAKLAPGTVSVLPMQLRAGDGFTDEEGEWEIVGRPWNIHSAKTVHVRVQLPGDQGTKREKSWPAHERVTVTRATS